MRIIREKYNDLFISKGFIKVDKYYFDDTFTTTGTWFSGIENVYVSASHLDIEKRVMRFFYVENDIFISHFIASLEGFETDYKGLKSCLINWIEIVNKQKTHL